MTEPVHRGFAGRPAHGLATTAVLGGYALASWWLLHRLGLADRTRLPGCACGDQALETWLLAYPRYALAHHASALFTVRADLPSGFNLLDNASMPLLGTLAVPVTAALGPIASYVLLTRLAFLLSAAAGFAVLRRLDLSVGAAGLGGALYGFSPYLAHQGVVHLFLAFVPLPPLLLLLAYRQLVAAAGGRRPFRAGLLWGALGVAQFFIASEVLVTTLFLGGLTALVGAVGALRGRRRLPWRAAARFSAGAAVVLVVLLAYPAWYALAGPGHVAGATQAAGPTGFDLASAVLPVDREVLAGALGSWTDPVRNYAGDTGYLGPLLLGVALAVALRRRREPLVAAAASLGGLAFLLALGPRLRVWGHATAVPLPFALLARMPVLQDVVANRLTLFVDLAAAVLVAVAVDRLRAAAGGGAARRGSAALRARAGLVALVVAVAATLPSTAYRPAPAPIAARFASRPVQRLLGTDLVALSYPYPAFPADQAMLWQAESGLDFRLLGGYAIRAGPDAAATKNPVTPAPAVVAQFLLHALPASRYLAPTAPALSLVRTALAGFVRRWRVALLLVQLGLPGSPAVLALFGHAFGRPRHFPGLDLWRLAAPPVGVASPPGGLGAGSSGHDSPLLPGSTTPTDSTATPVVQARPDSATNVAE